tara:strand:- start:404 stop:1291 length:888 start_codon:yes stop_codon:yes gene_type:complete
MAVKTKKSKKAEKSKSTKKLSKKYDDDDERDLEERLKAQAKEGDKRNTKKIPLDLSKFNGEINFYKMKSGKDINKLDIIPFRVSEKYYQNLLQHSNIPTDRKIGKLEPSLIIPVHRGVGLGNKSVLCKQSAFQKPCFICEQALELIKDGYEKNEEQIRRLRPSWRGFYNVIDRTSKKKDILLLEASFYNFEKNLREEIETSDEGNVAYASLKNGKTLKFKGKEKKLGKIIFIDVPTFDFIDREALDPALISKAISLDSSLIIPEYEEVKSLYLEDVKDEDEDEDVKDDDDDDDED